MFVNLNRYFDPYLCCNERKFATFKTFFLGEVMGTDEIYSGLLISL